jgi:hypothetical protein
MLSRISVITKLYAMLALMLLGMAGVALLASGYIPEADRNAFHAGAALLIGVVMVVGTVLRFSIRAGILASIRAASHVIGRVAEGDLTA